MKNLTIAIVLFLSSLSFTYGQNCTLSFPCLGVQQAGYVNIPLTCDTIDALVAGIELYITYDSDIIEAIGFFDLHPIFENDPPTINLQYSQNEIFFLWTDGTFMGQEINPGESLFSITFDYNGFGTSEIIIDGNMGDPLYNMFNLTVINGCIGPDCICDGYTWTGEQDNNWFNPNNWNTLAIPSNSDVVTIPFDGVIHFPTIESYGAKTLSISINPNAFLKILPGGSLTTYGNTTIEGALMIESDENGYSGSYINNGMVAGSGKFEFNRHITNSSSLSEISGWHFISSPVDGFRSDSIPDYMINQWDENFGSWQFIQQTGDCNPANPPVTIDPMEGWSIKLDEDYISNCGFGTGSIIEMIGNVSDLHSGSVDIPYTFTPGNPNIGWNLIGNPYPCSIDPMEIDWPENLNQSLYFWDGNINTYFSWAGGVGPEYIAPTQGFFLNATGNGTFAFYGSERIHDSIGGPWLKDKIEDLITLKATAENPEFYDLTYIRELNNSTFEFDKEWDAYKLLAINSATPQFYTHFGDILYSINTQPDLFELIELGFEAGESGTFTIEAIETSDIEELYLEDMYYGSFTDLLTESYTFDYTIGDIPERFMIHFFTISVTEVWDSQIKIWSAEKNIMVKTLEETQGKIRVFDLLGQIVAQEQINSPTTKIPINTEGHFFIVEVITQDAKVNKTVFCY